MKRIFISLALALGFIAQASAQTVVYSTDFEDWADLTTGNWTFESKTASAEKKNWTLWVNKTTGALSGKQSLEAGSFTATNELAENWAITPKVTLAEGKEYKLDLLWGQASYSYAIEKGTYDFSIRVNCEGSDTWDEVFNFSDPEQVEASGVSFPWSNWSTNHSVVDISDYAGKTIQVAFVYKEKDYLIDNFTGNTVAFDDFSIEEYEAVRTPIPTTATTSYTFPATYIGTRSYSEDIVVTNTGVGNLEVTGIEGIEGTDFTTNLDPQSISVKKNDSFSFNVIYTPTLMGAAQTTLVLKTNGGDVSIKLVGQKTILSDGYTYEGFEGNTFPPAGWTKTRSAWNSLNSSFSGDNCAWGTSTWEEGESALITPRMDLSDPDTEYNLTFDFYEQYSQLVENGYEQPDNYFQCYFSANGGQTWTLVYDQDDHSNYNARVRYTYNIGTPKSDNCYFKWVYDMGEIDSDNADDYEYSNIFLDDVILPPLYGATSAPGAAQVGTPAIDATDVNVRELSLKWNEVQFAESYKVFLGTADGNWDVINGTETTATCMNAPRLQNATQYFWKVVAVNAYGETENAPVWSFTTIEDKSVKAYPFFEGFEESEGKIPTGWMVKDNGKHCAWKLSQYYTYEGGYKAFATGSYNDALTELISPEFYLPSDGMQISFFWGNNTNPAKDDLGQAQNTSTSADDIDAIYFDIYSDNGWEQLGLISMNSEFYNREVFDLSQYAGQVVTFRWRYELKNANRRRGASIDNIKVENLSDTQAYFNMESWNAGRVNYCGTADTGNSMALINGGTTSLTVESAAFEGAHFTADIPVGTEIESNKSITFCLKYNAGTEVGENNDVLTVSFTDGTSVALPVVGTTLGSDMLFFNFDNDEHGTTQPEGLTTYDKDHLTNYGSWGIDWPNEGTAYAYVVINVDAEHSDWRNVYPISGNQVLAASAPSSSTDALSSDWLISPQLNATSTSKLTFWGKSYGTDDEYNDFAPHYYEVWVSTTDANPSSFTQLQTKKQISKNDAKWYQYSVDLSKYADQKVYVALVHVANTNGYIAFFDDLCYEHFTDAYKGGKLLGDANNDGTLTMADANLIVNYFTNGTATGINTVAADVNEDGNITMADANKVANMYVGGNN